MKRMKRYLSFLLAGVLVLALTACGGTSSTASSEASSAAPSEASTAAPAETSADASSDASSNASVEAPAAVSSDASSNASVEAPADVSSDASSNASVEAPAAVPSEASSADEATWDPEENITMIVSYKAGSGTDNTARVLAAYAEKYLGKPVIIENLEGGSGSIGWTALSQADPDGYTLGFLNLPNFNATIVEGLASYSVDSFAPICNHVTETSLILVKADSEFETLEDLVSYAKEHPGELKASTNGSHASNHIGAQVLATSAEFEYTDIPYGGTADQLLALRQGEVDFSVAKEADFASFTSDVKALAVYSTERLEGYPDVPTMGELGYYDQWLGSSRCIVAPAGTPENILAYYEKAFRELMEDPDYLKAAEAAGMETDYINREDTAALIQQQQDFTEGLEDVWGD